MAYRTRISLTEEYEMKLSIIKEELSCEDKEVFLELIDLYLLESPRHVSMVRGSLVRRFRQGLGYEFAAQLKALLNLIEFSLKKIRYIK